VDRATDIRGFVSVAVGPLGGAERGGGCVEGLDGVVGGTGRICAVLTGPVFAVDERAAGGGVVFKSSDFLSSRARMRLLTAVILWDVSALLDVRNL